MTTFDPFDPLGFKEIRREQEVWRDTAKRDLLPGIDPADLRVGMKITISPNLRTGDRSGTTELHTILAFNTGHVQTHTDAGFYKDRPGLWLVSEHHFYLADAFVAPPTS